MSSHYLDVNKSVLSLSQTTSVIFSVSGIPEKPYTE